MNILRNKFSKQIHFLGFGIILVLFPAASFANIIPCGKSFASFKDSFRDEAIERGYQTELVNRFLSTVVLDPDVIRRDRSQGIFKKSFIEFSKLVMSNHRIVKGAEFYAVHKPVFDQVQKMYGVPQGVLLSFLALETDYGLVQGDHNTLNSIFTLSHDCRRPELFQPHLFAALELFSRNNFDPENTTGAWAGEIGMIQMLPNDIVKYGVDADGNGSIDLQTSVFDALMTAGNILSTLGWEPNQPWLVEVVVPESMPWELSSVDNYVPIEEWKRLGVKTRNEVLYENMGKEAALLLPHGRKGPAFFAFPNFQLYLEWNKSLVYTTTSAFFATLLSGEPMYLEGDAPPQLSGTQIEQLQTQLTELGYNVGKVDGIIGSKTRAAVRSEQLKYGLPADSWPTTELLDAIF